VEEETKKEEPMKNVVGLRSTKEQKKQKSDPAHEPNAKNFFRILDSLNEEYKTNRGGYHEQAYRLMAKAMHVALLLNSNKKLKRRFIRRIRPKSVGKGSSASINIVTEVMVYVMGAKCDANRKIAWKRGRVIEFLHGEGIKIAKIAGEIQSRGGIEAVLKQAAKEKPRRDKGSAGIKTSGKKPAAVLATSRYKSGHDTPDRDEPDTARSPATMRRNDEQMAMPVLINLSDRDLLADLPVGSRVKVFATRISRKNALIEVSGIKALNVSLRKSNDDDDWDEF
jgi:hypothetical protein